MEREEKTPLKHPNQRKESLTGRHNELEILRKAKRGDQEAFGELVKKYYEGIYNIARATTGNDDDAGDITQETFMRAFTSLSKFRGQSQFFTWIYRIMINLINEKARRRGIEKRGYEKVSHKEPRNTTGVDSFDKERIMQAVDGLPLQLKQAFLLREIEGMSYKEIAEVLSCPLGTVDSRISRAWQHVMNKLGKEL